MAEQISADQLTIFQQGVKLCPPHYDSTTQRSKNPKGSTGSMKSMRSTSSMSSTRYTRSKELIKVCKSTRILNPRGQLFTKNNAYVFLSTILFLGCIAFVAYRGYRCFDKYLKKPEHTEISYKSSKSYPFPSFTLCATYKDSYNGEQMKECQLERSEYIEGGTWVGKGGNNCTDPKILHNKVAASYEDLVIKSIHILTYAASDNYYWIQPSNWSLLKVKLALTRPYQRCFTFSIPDNIVREGIKSVSIRSKPFDSFYIHKEGTLWAPITGSLLKSKYDEIYHASVTHESIQLLNYDGMNCNNNGKYNYDKANKTTFLRYHMRAI